MRLIPQEGGAEEVARVERLIDSYFKDIGLPTRLIDEVPATASAAEEYLHFLMPRYAKRRLDINPVFAKSTKSAEVICDNDSNSVEQGADGLVPFERLLQRMVLVAETRGTVAKPDTVSTASTNATAANTTTSTRGHNSSVANDQPRWTLLHKNPEECDALALHHALPANAKLIYIERDRPVTQ